MKLVLLSLACLCLIGSVPATDADRTVVVWPEERVGVEYWVPFAVHGQHGVARCGTVEEARMLYAVLARAMTNSSGGKNAE